MSVSRETSSARYFPEKSGEALAYADLLATTAIQRGLIGPREADRVWQRHIENCIPLTTLLPDQNATVADVGSGAGLPGIVIALAKPRLQVTLIEPLQRRVEFLYEVVDALKIRNIEIIRAKSEVVKGVFNFVTARAVAPLPRLIQTTWHLVAPGGSLLAMKGESAAAEMAESDLSIAAKTQLHEIKIDDLPLARIVEVQKAG
ncbi:MAG: 16S rRNA (guanine(527)-N(7))-methyltransferase RsmG [Candidatus Nanopelagicaceae bacterium]|nr:16S rRNA (guanine(527)-N(7))-methyltransferase RsmG [Candidatus Nanopelagicaceae bacterium]